MAGEVRYQEISPDDICECGHLKIDHIHGDGACRPGWVCGQSCEKFKSGFKITGMGHWKYVGPQEWPKKKKSK